jgi:hypothetical protein
MRIAAELLVGSPYLSNPLIGGPAEPERLILGLDAFDCVTFVETVLALARSGSEAKFRLELRRTRYRAGCVGWRTRLHYFSEWLQANQRRGAVRLRTAGPGARIIQARLAILEGLPPRSVRFPVVPRRSLPLAAARLGAVSIVAFASLRSGLDYFHTGLVVRDFPDQPVPALTLIHAARSAGRVVREPLGAFLARNRMRGISFAAPLPAGDSR